MSQWEVMTGLDKPEVQELEPDAMETRCADCWMKDRQCPLCAYTDKKQQYQKDLNDLAILD